MNEVQTHILGIYKVFAELCEKHGLRYHAIGGTAIGAARHKGFIPWDDDLDVSMPDVDYLRFLDIARVELPDGFEVRAYQISEFFPYVYARVIDSNTTFVSSRIINLPQAYHGVWMDVMPMSGFPSDLGERKKHMRRLWLNVRLGQKMFFRMKDNPTLKGKLFWLMSSPLQLAFPRNHFYDEYYKAIKDYPFDECDFTGYTWSQLWRGLKLLFPREWFDGYVELPFEDTVIRCPKAYDDYLSTQFGDYMTPPPVDKQIPSHGLFVDLEHSYKDYLCGKRTPTIA